MADIQRPSWMSDLQVRDILADSPSGIKVTGIVEIPDASIQVDSLVHQALTVHAANFISHAVYTPALEGEFPPEWTPPALPHRILEIPQQQEPVIPPAYLAIYKEYPNITQERLDHLAKDVSRPYAKNTLDILIRPDAYKLSLPYAAGVAACALNIPATSALERMVMTTCVPEVVRALFHTLQLHHGLTEYDPNHCVFEWTLAQAGRSATRSRVYYARLAALKDMRKRQDVMPLLATAAYQGQKAKK